MAIVVCTKFSRRVECCLGKEESEMLEKEDKRQFGCLEGTIWSFSRGGQIHI